MVQRLVGDHSSGLTFLGTTHVLVSWCGGEDAAATAGKMPALLGESVTIFLRPADTYFD